MPEPRVIETHQLTKRFGRFAAVEALDLSVRAHQITGFLGRNGAGKSTTIKMLLNMTHPTSGTGTLTGSCGSSGSSGERVYRWTPATSGQATLQTCGGGTGYDTLVYLRSGTCTGAEVACNDDTPGCAVADGTGLINAFVWAMPDACSWKLPIANTASTSTLSTAARSGRAPTRVANPAQKPPWRGLSPGCGTSGQKIRRPNSRSSAG